MQTFQKLQVQPKVSTHGLYGDPRSVLVVRCSPPSTLPQNSPEISSKGQPTPGPTDRRNIQRLFLKREVKGRKPSSSPEIESFLCGIRHQNSGGGNLSQFQQKSSTPAPSSASILSSKFRHDQKGGNNSRAQSTTSAAPVGRPTLQGNSSGTGGG
uniref:Uncharacterized protein n=1 Tax=Solanum tuberosum TaxID=4113 RepID=M1DRP8_SOLTU